MTARFTIEFNDAPLLARLNAAVQGLANPRELLDLVGAQLESNTALRIDEYKVDPSGAPWAAIKPATAAAIKRANKGVLVGSLLDRASQGMRAGLTHNLVGEQAVEIGFTRRYAIYHEFGTKHMPRRGLLTANPQSGELGAQDREDVLEAVQRYLNELL